MCLTDISGCQEIYCRRIDGKKESPWLVFLHEGLGCSAMWKDFPERLCTKTGCPGLVYDRPGHGRSPSPSRPRTVHYLHEAALHDLPEVLSRFLPGREYILIGHSDGGSISLIFAGEKPPLLKAVITEAAHVFVEPETVQGIEHAVAAYEAGQLQGLARYHGEKTDTLFRAWADTWLSPWFTSWNIEYVLPSVACPLLVLQGRDDQYGTVRQVESLVAKTAGRTEAVLVEECGHAPHQQQTEKVLQRMADFINRWK